jgi:hypothetical protein
MHKIDSTSITTPKKMQPQDQSTQSTTVISPTAVKNANSVWKETTNAEPWDVVVGIAKENNTSCDIDHDMA